MYWWVDGGISHGWLQVRDAPGPQEGTRGE